MAYTIKEWSTANVRFFSKYIRKLAVVNLHEAGYNPIFSKKSSGKCTQTNDQSSRGNNG